MAAVELLPRLFAAAAAAAVAGCVGASSWLSPLLPLPELSKQKLLSLYCLLIQIETNKLIHLRNSPSRI
jgi:hypothetical protein